MLLFMLNANFHINLHKSKYKKNEVEKKLCYISKAMNGKLVCWKVHAPHGIFNFF